MLDSALRRSLLLSLMGTVACGGVTTPLYPPRPEPVPGNAMADPQPARVDMHVTVARTALSWAIDQAVPAIGAGTFPLLGSQRRYVWKRMPVDVGFVQGRVRIRAHVVATLEVGTLLEFPLDLTIFGEPVIASDYRATLQSVEVQVTSDDPRLKAAEGMGGALRRIGDQIQRKLEEFRFDLKPLIGEAYRRLSTPIDLPLGDAHGCALLQVVDVEAGPTVLADGIEKDLALVVLPSVTLPCAAPLVTPPLPPLHNVATLIPGPFEVEVPIAARYEELAHAMTLAFTDGKLYFTKEFPQLYMEKPEIYAAKDQLVLKLHMFGPINKYGIHANLDGDLYMNGHPEVVDNELRIPDLQPTIETGSFLLRLKAALDGDSIRDQARAALHLDLNQRFADVRAKLSTELSFNSGDPQPSPSPGAVAAPPAPAGCVRAAVDKMTVSGLHAHQGYLRLYLKLDARASAYLPCPDSAPMPAAPPAPQAQR